MSLPLRVIDSGAKDTPGTVAFGAVTDGTFSVGEALTLGGLVSFFDFSSVA
jgi:hypothetical protein